MSEQSVAQFQMSTTESSWSEDWFAQGDMDIQAAEILHSQSGPPSIVAFHIQQAIEKYLKGFLLAHDWSLRRIHDLEVLIHDAIDRDTDFYRLSSALPADN